MSRAKGKGNKDILASINDSLDIIKKIESGEEFSQQEKQDILDKYIGVSKDNNSYWTPVIICDWMRQILDIKSGKIADFASGIGNMAIPFVTEYGKLVDGITFDMYELCPNNSMALKTAWSDYEQVNVYGDFNTLNRADEIEDNTYDFVIGNPPFVGSQLYLCDWNQVDKGKKKGQAKNNSVMSAFVDLAVKKTKSEGYIAMILPNGHLTNSNAFEKLRTWLKGQVALKAVIPLSEETFSKAGVTGTKVGTSLIIWQKGVEQGKVMIAELHDDKDIKGEMATIAQQFKLLHSGEYEIQHVSDSYSGLHSKLRPALKPWEVVQ